MVDAVKSILLDSFSKWIFLQGGFYVLNADGNERDSSQTSHRLGPLTCIYKRNRQPENTQQQHKKGSVALMAMWEPLTGLTGRRSLLFSANQSMDDTQLHS